MTDIITINKQIKNATRRLSYHKLKQENPDFLTHNAKMARRRYADARNYIITQLGGACQICGRYDNLNIHHKSGGGDACRNNHGGGYSHLRFHINSGLIGLEIVCRSCHFERHGGYWGSKK